MKKVFIAVFVLLLYFIFSFPAITASSANSEPPKQQTEQSKQQDEKIQKQNGQPEQQTEQPKQPSFIKWLDFNVTSDLLSRAYKADPQNICELLAYVAIKNGNNFASNKSRDAKNLNAVINDRSLLDKYRENKYYKYYVDCYHAILDGIIGEYYIDENQTKTFGLKAYHPIARGFGFNCYDDFGSARGYGYKRRHLGHDLFGRTGTPIVAVEGGTITELGWNRFGGWRIGIRSEDTKRYYYYAHLRKDKPFAANLKKGDKVAAGQVIGYLGTTGYSRKENVNMKQGKPHLHFGIQIIFDKSQEDGAGEIWIDCWQLCKFLSQNRMKVIKDPETREYSSVLDNNDPEPQPEPELETEITKKRKAKKRLIPFFGVINQRTSDSLPLLISDN